MYTVYPAIYSQYIYIPPDPYPTVAIARQKVNLGCSGTIQNRARSHR